jgi:hypothetical protein
MATHTGTEGRVVIGGAGIVGELRSFSVEAISDTIETTTMGLTSRRYTPSLRNWTGSFDVYWDENDVGQAGIVNGAEISISFRPEGQDAGDVFYSGAGIITSVSLGSSFDGLVESSISIQGRGFLSTSTQP